MAHEISRENFFDVTGQAAWHRLDVMNKLGITREDREYFAPEVFGFFGRPQYSMFQTYWKDSDGNEIADGDYIIVRHPVDDDPEFRKIGKASENYELVAMEQAVNLWHNHINLPVATMMSLRNDGVLVITAELPEYDVKNEQIKSYLVFTNGMDGRTATRSDVSDVRVVCANTLRRAQSTSQQNFIVHHTSGSMDRLTEWMKTVVDRAMFQRDVNAEVYDILAESKFEVEQVRWIADTVYRDPAKPRRDFSYKNGYEFTVQRWEKEMENAQKKRDYLVQLFQDNSAIGFSAEESTTQGTAWHALNCVSQVLTHGRTSSFDARAESLVIGDRASTLDTVTNMIIGTVPEAYEVSTREYEKVLV